MKIEENEHELIIKEMPGILWLFGLFFAGIGSVFVYGSLGGFTDWDKISWWTNLLAFTMGVIGVGIGIWQIWLAPVTKLVANQRTKKITITKRSLFKTEQNAYDFDQIKGFRVIEDKDSENDPIWYFGLEFTSGELVKISSLPSHSENYKLNRVFESNQFIGKQIPAQQLVNEPEDESLREIS